MDKCTYCAGGPEADGSQAEYEKYGSNRLAEGKLPLCAEMCSTKSLLAGDGEIIAQIYKERVVKRGYGSGAWGWKTAYGDHRDLNESRAARRQRRAAAPIVRQGRRTRRTWHGEMACTGSFHHRRAGARARRRGGGAGDRRSSRPRSIRPRAR